MASALGNISAGITAAVGRLTGWAGPYVYRSPMMTSAATSTASAPAQ
jgi:hypothetical protein